jgi:phenol 2-monooxygenase
LLIGSDFRVFIDDVNTLEKIGGDGYKYYGIDRKDGAIVIVRPDGYVGTVAPLCGTSHLKDYFAGFMSRV